MAASLCSSATPSARMANQASTSGRVAACPSLAPARPAAFSRRSSRRTANSLVVSASTTPLPKGVTAPPRQPEKPEVMTGFVRFAEKINGRAAMLGFFGILFVEAIAGRGIFEMAGFQVGKGLGFEF